MDDVDIFAGQLGGHGKAPIGMLLMPVDTFEEDIPAVEQELAVLNADGEDLCFVNVSLVDRNGNPVPVDSRLVKVKVSGAGTFKAIGNGDPTCLEPFHLPQMHLFSGQLTIIVQGSHEPGEMTVEVEAKGVKKAVCEISVR